MAPSYIAYHLTRTLEDTKIWNAKVAMLMFTINTSTYKESKIMYGRKVNAPYGSLCDISSFSHSDASKENIVFRFVRFTKKAPLWDFASSIKIFKVHGI